MHERYNDMVEHLGTPVFECDSKGILVFLNQDWYRWFGDRSGDALGTCITRFLEQKDHRDALQLVSEPDGSRRELPFVDFHGVASSFEMSVNLLGNGNRVGLLYPIGPTSYEPQNTRHQELLTKNKILKELNNHLKQQILQKKKELSELEEKEKYISTVINSVSSGVIVVDERSLKIIDLNQYAADVIGGDKETLVGQDSLLFLPKGDQEEIRTSGSGTSESFLTRNDGTLLPILLSVVNMTSTGHPYLVKSFIDISLLKETEVEQSKLKDHTLQSQKMEAIGRLAGGVAHDFNNILTVIACYSEMVLANLNPGEFHYDEIVGIRESTTKGAELTKQLLAFSRRQTISPEIININRIIHKTKTMLVRLIGEDIELKFKPSKQSWNVRMDPGQLHQILLNLVVNSRDAMPCGGDLEIATKTISLSEDDVRHNPEATAGQYVLLEVSDNGKGMDSETLSLIFEPFFTTKAKTKGTGFGLATVYGIIKQNKGFIEVYSKIGVGSTFLFYLPRVANAVESVLIPRPVSLPLGSETILLVEDESVVRILARRILERLGYKILEALDSSHALAICQRYKGKIDLLFTDVVMPKMNGRELAEKVIESRSGIKILFMSGYTKNIVAKHGVFEHDCAFLQKPFLVSALVQKVREVLDDPDNSIDSGQPCSI